MCFNLSNSKYGFSIYNHLYQQLIGASFLFIIGTPLTRQKVATWVKNRFQSFSQSEIRCLLKETATVLYTNPSKPFQSNIIHIIIRNVVLAKTVSQLMPQTEHFFERLPFVLALLDLQANYTTVEAIIEINNYPWTQRIRPLYYLNLAEVMALEEKYEAAAFLLQEVYDNAFKHLT